MNELIQWSKRPGNEVLNAEPPGSPFPEGFEDEYLKKVYDGDIDLDKLDADYHAIVGGHLYEGAATGFGGAVGNFGAKTIEAQTIQALKLDIFRFSAAKQYQQVRVLKMFILKGGENSTFKDFKKEAEKIFSAYNKNYLKTEYTTAVGQAQSARDWVEFYKYRDVLPILEYKTQKDELVRHEHRKLHGIKRKVTDNFWRLYMPKNGWNCRCFVVAKSEGKETNLDGKELPSKDSKDFPEVFQINPGIDKRIFGPSHPYYEVPEKHNKLKKRNFNLFE